MSLFEFFESKKDKKIKSHFKNLIKIAFADGVIDDEEKKLLTIFSKKWGFQMKDIEDLISELKEYPTNTLPESDTEKFHLLYEMVEMMLADGTIEDTEMEFICEIACKFGFRRAVVNILVKKIVMGIQEQIPIEKLRDEVNPFLDLN